ncbi:MAG: hypothetical protein ABSA30_04820, partial [Candidatus Aminicenantales bacterium]
MNRSRRKGILVWLAALAFVPAGLRAQNDVPAGLHLKPGFNFEYLSRTLSWDNDTHMSTVILPTGYFSVDYEVARGFTFGVLAGYTLSNFDGLVFRQLPFSLDYEAGAINGFVLGAQMQKSLFSSGFWEITADAQFLASLGSTQTFTIDQLNTSGSFNAKGTWMHLQVGPTVIYRGFELFSPFIGVAYDRFWGTFTVNETIGDLAGTEAKSVSGKGAAALTLGTIYEPSPNFSLKVSGTAIPYNKGT